MGKKSRIKKERQQMPSKKPALLDPVLIESFVKGRESGHKEGRIEGTADMMSLMSQWIGEIDQHVKGIGPKTKVDIELYLAEKIRELIETNTLKDIAINELPKQANA